MGGISRRDLLRKGLEVSAAGALCSTLAQPTSPKRLAEVGWVWEGQGLDGGVDPSVFGVGEGAEYFGLTKVCYMFHPNDELAMWKLRKMEQVVCDITKWKFSRCDGGIKKSGGQQWLDPAVRA